MIDIILAAVMGPLDRLRGGLFPEVKSQIGGLLYGLALASLLTQEPWQIAILMAAFMLGEASGWGCPLGEALSGKYDGCKYEWYQVGPLKQSPWMSLFVRGYIWGLPMALAGIFIGVPMALAIPFIFALATPLAPAICRLSTGWQNAKYMWPTQEWVRGWLVGFMTLGVVWNF